MKIAILALVALAIIGPRAISVIAHKLKGPWTTPQIDALVPRYGGGRLAG
jgi:hypothetical protein